MLLHTTVTMSNILPSTQQLQRAIQLSEQIEKLETELKSLLAGNGRAPVATTVSKPSKGKGKRTMSPEARERIAAAQRARWAKARGGKAAKPAASSAVASPASSTRKPKRKVSAQARARMAAAAKKRWAKAKNAKA
jgi:hypothetical protein